MSRYLGSIPVPFTASKNGGTAPFEAEEAQGGGPSVVRPWDEPIRSRVGVTPLDVRFPPNKVPEFFAHVCFRVSSDFHLVLAGGNLKPNRSTSQPDTLLGQKSLIQEVFVQSY